MKQGLVGIKAVHALCVAPSRFMPNSNSQSPVKDSSILFPDLLEIQPTNSQKLAKTSSSFIQLYHCYNHVFKVFLFTRYQPFLLITQRQLPLPLMEC